MGTFIEILFDNIICIIVLTILLVPGIEIEIRTKNFIHSYSSKLFYTRLKNAFRRNKKDDKK